MPPNGSTTDSRDLWKVVNETRKDVAEIKGMLRMHINEPSIHQRPPCPQVQELQHTMLAAAGAAVVALLAALGSIVATVLK